MSKDHKSEKILRLKLEIDDLKEYLYSDSCRGCGEAVLRLEKIIQELLDLSHNDANS